MSISAISASTVEPVSNLKPGTGTNGGFTVSRYISRADTETPTAASPVAGAATTDTVSISDAARAQNVTTAAADDTPEALKNMAIPSWLAPYFPRVPLVGQTAAESDRINARFNALSASEQGQYYQLLDQHYHALLEDNHLLDNPQRYDLLVNNRETSEQFRLDFEKRIAADSTLSVLLARMQGAG